MTEIEFTAQLNTNNGQSADWDSSMNQGLWQQAMGHHHHHRCDNQDGSGNGQQGISNQLQQIEQMIQSLLNQVSSLEGGQGNSPSGDDSSNSSMSGILQFATMLPGLFGA
jgi:stress response protein SCP2